MQLKQRGRNAERLAEQAWDNLTTAVESTGRRTRKIADEAGSRMSATSDEARRRAGAAMDALAGRKPRKPWTWLAGALALGTLLGWLTAAFGRKAMQRTAHTHDDESLPADLGELGATTEIPVRPM